MGRLSGIGWGMGYAGGLVALVVVLLTMVLPDEPMFGLDPAAKEAERLVGPVSAGWLFVFLLPFFLLTPDLQPRGMGLAASAREGLRRLAATAGHAGHLGNILRFLIARMLYHDGLTAMMSFGGIYGAGVFDWDTTTLGLFAIILTVAAVPGTFFGGWLADRIGAKGAVVLSVSGIIAGAIGVLSVGREVVLFAVPVAAPPADGAVFAGTAERVFLAFGFLIGFCVGPAQAASRTLMARIAPAGMMTEFFGLYAFSGKATAFAAPLLIGVVTGLTGAQRPGLLVVLVFMAGGLLVFLTVREERSPAPVPPAGRDGS
jgi:UMF1 family MFS transporter